MRRVNMCIFFVNTKIKTPNATLLIFAIALLLFCRVRRFFFCRRNIRRALLKMSVQILDANMSAGGAERGAHAQNVCTNSIQYINEWESAPNAPVVQSLGGNSISVSFFGSPAAVRIDNCQYLTQAAVAAVVVAATMLCGACCGTS